MRKSNEDVFKAVVSEYEGRFVERFGRTYFTSKNEICSFYEDGKIHTKKKVDCFIGISTLGSLDVFESTHEILGGALTSFSEIILRRYLERYNFKRKVLKIEQLSLFDVI